MTEEMLLAGQGPRRASLALPNTRVADDVAREWGEAVWTHQILYRIHCLDRTAVTTIPFVLPPVRRRA